MQQGGQGWLGGPAGYPPSAPAATGYDSAAAILQAYPASNGSYAYDQQQAAACSTHASGGGAAAVAPDYNYSNGGAAAAPAYNYSNGGAATTDPAAAAYYQQQPGSSGYAAQAPPMQQQYGDPHRGYDPQQAFSGGAQQTYDYSAAAGATSGGGWAPGGHPAAAPAYGYTQAGSSSGQHTMAYQQGNPAADAAGGAGSYPQYSSNPAAPYPGAAPYTPPVHPQQQQQQQPLQHQGSSMSSMVGQGGLMHQGSSSVFPVPTGPCYDVTLVIERCSKLPMMDWHTMKADPYIVCKFMLPSGHSMAYRTQTVKRDLNPVYNETVVLYSIPQGTRFDFQVTDKDMINPDRLIAHGEYILTPAQTQGEQSVAVALAMSKKDRGQLHLQVRWTLCAVPVSPFMGGPVRYREHMSPLAGALLGAWQDDNSLQFCTYKLYLMNIEEMFLGVSCPWNRSYDKARQIFESATLSSTISTQHKALYATSVGANRSGTVSSPAELFKLLSCGRRGGQLRYFTYTLLKDSMRFSETGAAFMADMFSKHAMHANCTPEVLMAGEFFLCPDPAAPGGHRVVVDNNSGTYAPPAALLPRVGTLLQRNFPGLVVELVAADDPKLKQYHAMVPSRKAPA